MAYITKTRPNRVESPGLGFDWPSWVPWGKSDEEKAAETISNVNQAVEQFRQAHEKAVALYQAGLLSDKLRQRHVELRDDLNNLLVKIFDAVSPQEYLDIHNYLAQVRSDVGLGLAPLIIIGAIALVAAAAATAVTVNRNITKHNKELDVEIAKIDLVQQGKASPDIINKGNGGNGKSFFEEIFGIDPKLLMAAALLVPAIPFGYKFLKKRIK